MSNFCNHFPSVLIRTTLLPPSSNYSRESGGAASAAACNARVTHRYALWDLLQERCVILAPFHTQLIHSKATKKKKKKTRGRE